MATGSGASESDAHKLIVNPFANCIGVFFLISSAFAPLWAGSSRTIRGSSFVAFSLQDANIATANNALSGRHKDFERIILLEKIRSLLLQQPKEKKKFGFEKLKSD